MPNLLQDFQRDEHTRLAVEEFFMDQLGQIAKEKAFSGEETTGISDAVVAIELAFSELERKYAVKQTKENIDHAR